MPQRQLPIFPAGVTEINNSIAVQKEAGQVVYIHGHLPVFHHEEEDIGSFRMFTSQMIVNGTVKPKEIVKAFGVPVITVKRYVKVFRDRLADIRDQVAAALKKGKKKEDLASLGITDKYEAEWGKGFLKGNDFVLMIAEELKGK